MKQSGTEPQLMTSRRIPPDAALRIGKPMPFTSRLAGTSHVFYRVGSNPYVTVITPSRPMRNSDLDSYNLRLQSLALEANNISITEESTMNGRIHIVRIPGHPLASFASFAESFSHETKGISSIKMRVAERRNDECDVEIAFDQRELNTDWWIRATIYLVEGVYDVETLGKGPMWGINKAKSPNVKPRRYVDRHYLVARNCWGVDIAGMCVNKQGPAKDGDSWGVITNGQREVITDLNQLDKLFYPQEQPLNKYIKFKEMCNLAMRGSLQNTLSKHGISKREAFSRWARQQ